MGEAARRGHSVYFLGHDQSDAPQAAEMLSDIYPDLVVAGCSTPWIATDDDVTMRRAVTTVRHSEPSLVLVPEQTIPLKDTIAELVDLVRSG